METYIHTLIAADPVFAPLQFQVERFFGLFLPSVLAALRDLRVTFPTLAFFFSSFEPTHFPKRPNPAKSFISRPPKTQQIRDVNTPENRLSPKLPRNQHFSRMNNLSDLPCPNCYSGNEGQVQPKPCKGLFLCS
jgi:hypothetical protein